MNDRFRELLHDRAARATVPPLADGARRRGRRLGRVHTVASGVAVVAVVAAAGGGYLAIRPSAADPLPVEAADGVQTSPVAPWTALPERLVYGNHDVATTWSGSDLTSVTLPYAYGDEKVEFWTASPNGHNVSAVTEEGLFIGSLENVGGDAVVHGDENLCNIQTWSPDSSRVMVGQCVGDTMNLVIVDARTGEATVTIEDTGIDPRVTDLRFGVDAVWTADGEHLVWGNTHGEHVIADADGANRREFDAGEAAVEQAVADYLAADPVIKNGEEFDYADSGFASLGITAVSADGTKVCHQVDFGIDADAPMRQDDVSTAAMPQNWCQFLVDTTTGELIEIPNQHHALIVAIGPEDEVVTRGWDESAEEPFQTVTLLAADGTVLDSRTEPTYDDVVAELMSYTD